MRGWAQADSIHFMDTLVLDIFFKKVRSEYTTFEQELMVRFERIQYFCEGTGHLLDFLLLISRQFIKIAVLRLTRIDLVADAIHACHEDRGESQIWIAGWVGRTEFNTLGFEIIRCRDAANGRTVALRICDVDRCFITRHQAAVRVGGR